MKTLEDTLTQDACYIKPIIIGEKTFHGIWSGTGQAIAYYEGREVAFAASVQHGMTPMSVH